MKKEKAEFITKMKEEHKVSLDELQEEVKALNAHFETKMNRPVNDKSVNESQRQSKKDILRTIVSKPYEKHPLQTIADMDDFLKKLKAEEFYNRLVSD